MKEIEMINSENHQEPQECAYCPRVAVTKDHVIPDNMLPPGTEPIYVPACKRCNLLKGRSDEYLRDHFATRFETSELPEFAPFKAKALKSLGRGYNSPIKKMLLTIQKQNVLNPDGTLGFASVVTTDVAEMRSALRWIARGLHFYHLKRRLDVSLDENFWAYNGSDNKKYFDLNWERHDLNGPFFVGQTVAYKVAVVKEVPDFSEWHFAFWNHVYFVFQFGKKKVENWRVSGDLLADRSS